MYYPAKLLIKCRNGIKVFSDMQTLKIFSPLTFFFRKLLNVFPPNERISHRWEDTRSRRQKIQNKREAKKFQGDGKGKSRVRAEQQAQKESKLKQKDKRIQKSCHQRQETRVGGEKERERERGREKVSHICQRIVCGTWKLSK